MPEWLGKLVLATVFPLVMRKAFGRTAGLCAMIIGLCAIGLVMLSLISHLLVGTLAVMIVLGPLIVIQYLYWYRKEKQERTTSHYLQAEPIAALRRSFRKKLKVKFIPSRSSVYIAAPSRSTL